MSKKQKTFGNLLATLTLFAVTVNQVFAQGNPSPTGPNPAPGNPSPTGPTPTPGNPSPGSGTSALQNPLQVNSVSELLVAILNVLIVIAVPIIVIFIILAGFKYVTARGNQNDIEDAHRALTYAVIGGVLIIGALAIAEIIKSLVEPFQNGV